MGKRSNGIVVEKAHLRGDDKAYQEGYERIFGKKKAKGSEDEVPEEGCYGDVDPKDLNLTPEQLVAEMDSNDEKVVKDAKISEEP